MIQGFVYTNGAGTIQNIVSAKGGTTRNWASQGAGFDDTTNCRYEIIKVRQLPVIATHSITVGNALIDATEANAFAAPVGVDLSAYQDGRHMLALYDSSGYAAIAHISATAPGGEALGDELITGWTNSTAPYETFTTSGTDITSAINTTSAGIAYCNTSLTNGALYRFVVTLTVNSGVAPNVSMRVSSISGDRTFILPAGGATGAYEQYTTLTVAAAYVQFSAGDPVNFSASGNSLKKLTTPPATGVLLLSRKGGDRGWLYKHASFNPNSAITAKILYVGD
jgi:hypothetical protein